MQTVKLETGKVFMNGRSQAVRIPQKFRFDSDVTEVYVQKVGNAVMLVPKDDLWETFLAGVNGFSDDFFEDGRQQGKQDERESL